MFQSQRRHQNSALALLAISALVCALVYSRNLENGPYSSKILLRESDTAFNPKDYEGDNQEPVPSINAESVQRYLDNLEQDIADLEKRVANIKDSDSDSNSVKIKADKGAR